MPENCLFSGDYRVGAAVAFMTSLPLNADVQFVTVMATTRLTSPPAREIRATAATGDARGKRINWPKAL